MSELPATYLKVIDSFSGEWRFLSNFYPATVPWDSFRYPTAEHAFQAAKCRLAADAFRIRSASSPSEAKRIGRQVPLRDHWEEVKRYVMLDVLRFKFQDPALAERLNDTGDADLVEGNRWHDNVWGNCTCGRPSCLKPGQNLLGKLLMQVRGELRGRRKESV